MNSFITFKIYGKISSFYVFAKYLNLKKKENFLYLIQFT